MNQMKGRKMSKKTWTAWGVRWKSKNRIDGESRQHLIGSCGVSPIPELRGCTGALMFATKRECIQHIKQKYGYIAKRKDLRDEPHGWRMPQATRIKITVRELSPQRKEQERE